MRRDQCVHLPLDNLLELRTRRSKSKQPCCLDNGFVRSHSEVDLHDCGHRLSNFHRRYHLRFTQRATRRITTITNRAVTSARRRKEVTVQYLNRRTRQSPQSVIDRMANPATSSLKSPELGNASGNFLSVNWSFNINDPLDNSRQLSDAKLVNLLARINPEGGDNVWLGLTSPVNGTVLVIAFLADDGRWLGGRQRTALAVASCPTSYAYSGILDGCHEFAQLIIGTMKPICTPDSVDYPSPAFKDRLPQTVAVTSRTRTVVVGPVALDAQYIAARVPWINNGQVDEEPGHSDLRVRLIALCSHGLGYLPLKLRVVLVAMCGSSVQQPGFGILEEGLEGLCTPRPCAFKSMSSARIEENTPQQSRARVISTFSRRSPPSLDKGPKCIAM